MRDNLYLVDTSVWLELLPAGRASEDLQARVDALLTADRVVMTGMVQLELLGGARNEAGYARLQALLSALYPLPIGEERWSEAAHLGFRLRRQGLTVPFTDLLIAAVAMAAGVTLLHRDRHVDLVARHVSLAVESHVPEATREP